jgi:transposase
MSEELPSFDPSEITDLKSARGLLAQLQMLITTLTGLVTELRESMAAKDTQIAELKRLVFGQKSERASGYRVSIGKDKGKPLTPEEKEKRRVAAQRKRKKNREERAAKLEEEQVKHSAPTTCPNCQSSGPFTELSPDVSSEIEYITERLVHLKHTLEKKVCSCGHIFSAPAPLRVTEGCHYGPGLHAYAVVSKCADSMPLNRIAKRFLRAGVHMSRSTLTDLFHRTAELLAPIHVRLLELVAASTYVNADETKQPVMDEKKCRRGYIWTFIASGIIAYIFSASRSGKTPVELLKGTRGKLQVDGYTGYNEVCLPEGRERIGCIAHCRRGFHKARDKCPDEADHCIGVIRELYQVEYDAAERNLLGTDAHRLMREDRSGPLLAEWKNWLEEKKGEHVPKSPMGNAIRYTINQWEFVTRFLKDPKLRLDNNISEGALRIIALGRDNFRWVGHDESGKNLAILQTIVATCIANDINPQDYIEDVLLRMQTHPDSRIDELLPMSWRPAA